MSNIVLYGLSPFSATIARTNDGVDGAVFMFSAHPNDLTPLIKLEFLLNTATIYIARWSLIGQEKPAELGITWEPMTGRLWSNVDADEIKRVARAGDLGSAKQILEDVLSVFHPDAAEKAMSGEVRAIFQALSDFTGRAFDIYVEPDRLERMEFVPELSESYADSWHLDAVYAVMYNVDARGYQPFYDSDGLVQGQAVKVRFAPQAPSEASTQAVRMFLQPKMRLVDADLLKYIAKGPSPRKPKQTAKQIADELRTINQSGER